MFSSLSRGYGSWTGDVDAHFPAAQDAMFPNVDHAHRHGITVSPRSRASSAIIPVAEDGQINIPKTFATRKGALMLFTAPDTMVKEPEKSPRAQRRHKRHHQKDVLDLSLKLKTLDRLSLSVLQFGDKLYDKDTSSVSDKENKMMLNFLHDLDNEQDKMDLHSQPGGDYKFYLRDLKRRASSRGHGVGDITPHKTRSAELQEILDDLEQAWPKYNQSSYRRDSTLTSSIASADNFMHTRTESPAPSTVSARSHSRGKVLSCKKLTASLKSLSSMGRPASTDLHPEPDTMSIVSDSYMASTQIRFGDSRRSKSAMWMSEISSPAHLNQSRPQTSYRSKSAMGQRGQGLKLVNTPEPSEVGTADGSKSQNTWMDIDAHGEMSYTSEDGHSMVSGVDSEYRVSERGHVMTPVREERLSTPPCGDRDAMLAEAASVLSSLVEEEDIIDLPADIVTDTTLDDTDACRWPGLTETEEQSDADGRRSAVSSRSKTPKTKSEPGDDVGLDNLVQPLEPPYLGPLKRDTRSTSPMEEGEEESYKVTQEGANSYTISRAASAEPGPEEAQMLLAGPRGSSPTSSRTTPMPRSDTPASSTGKVSQAVSDADPNRKSSDLGWASMTSTDKPSQDPDTLVSMFGRQHTADDCDKLPPSSPSPAGKSPSPLPSSSLPASEDANATPIPPATAFVEVPKVSTLDQKQAINLVEDAEEEDDENEYLPLERAAPKRREIKEERKSYNLEEASEGSNNVAGEEGDGKESAEKKATSEISDRVKQEMEEREQRQLKVKEEMAEKEVEEAKKRDAVDQKKLAAEEKRKAAEERIRLKAEEVAKKKEEERLRLEEASATTEEDELKKGAAAKEKDSKVKGGKKGTQVEDKKYVNALNITSTQQAGEASTGEDSLSKLKASNKDIDLPLDKIQDFMNAQTPPTKVEPEKEEVQIPEHMKDMFSRRTDSQAQEEMEEEIAKMRNAVDVALSGSVLEEGQVEGLSAEEFAAAQEALMEKLKQAEEQMLEAVAPDGAPKKSPSPRPKKQDKKGSPTRKKKGALDQSGKSDLAKEREAKKEEQILEKQKRLAEVKELQQKIAIKEGERKTKEEEAKRKAEELQEDMDSIRREEEELERAEQDAREQLAAVRKIQRDERETRRKADLERKKQEAIRQREKEKAMMDKAREKEQEMLDRIADGEMARRLREEDEAKREEEEQEAQERYEAEMREAQRLSEESEERLRELERQAEEEAFQRLVDEREAAEEKRFALEREARKMKEEEDMHRLEMLEEEKRLAEERQIYEAEEQTRREQERERLKELQRLEEQARDKMRVELDKRRSWAMKRREFNLEQRANLDAIRQCQGITDPWTYSYFVRWPKESYHRPMGHGPKRKTGPPRPKPKSATEPGAAGGGGSNAQSAVDVAAIP